MTLTDVRTQARRYSRVDSTAISDDRLNYLIQEAVYEFANDVGGFSMEKYPVISASFDTDTHLAIRVTIVGGANNVMAATDVAITATARSGTTGTIVASDFQTALRTAIDNDVAADITVSWDDFAFTVDTIDATSITYAAPSDANYADARELLGLTGTPTLTDFSHTGSFPDDCTVEYTLPTDMIYVERVEWDGKELYEAPREAAMSPEVKGTPHWYHIRGRTLYLIPAPDSQGLCKIWYRGQADAIVFSGYQECGLTGLTRATSDGLTPGVHSFKVAIDGGTLTEYSINPASSETYADIIALMNAQVSGATFAIVGGDLRCTSDSVGDTSRIVLGAGATGTDLFGALSGFSAFETAVSGDDSLPSEIPEMYQKAVALLTSYHMLLEQFDDKMGGQRYGQYAKIMRQFRLARLARNTRPDDNDYRRWGLRYTVNL